MHGVGLHRCCSAELPCFVCGDVGFIKAESIEKALFAAKFGCWAVVGEGEHILFTLHQTTTSVAFTRITSASAIVGVNAIVGSCGEDFIDVFFHNPWCSSSKQDIE